MNIDWEIVGVFLKLSIVLVCLWAASRLLSFWLGQRAIRMDL